MKKILLMLIMIVGFVYAKSFTFTAIPDQDETQLKERFSKLAVYLTKELDVDVKFIPVKSYSASIAAFRNNQVQLAWFGGLSGVKARLVVPGSIAIAQGVEDTQFRSYIIANTALGLEKNEAFPKEIADKTFTFGSKGSTSGRLMPEYFIRENFKKAPTDIFTKVGFSGSHTKTISLVESGAYQTGAVNFKVWDRELAAGNIDTSKVEILWTTPAYPDYQFTAHGNLDEVYGAGFTEKLTNALLNVKDKAILDAFPRSAFIKAKNSDFEPILETAKEIGLID